jgi:hypothetical protein
MPQDRGADRLSFQPCLLVGGQRKRKPAVYVTRHAPIVEDAHDLAIEQHRRRDRPVRHRSAGQQQPRNGQGGSQQTYTYTSTYTFTSTCTFALTFDL